MRPIEEANVDYDSPFALDGRTLNGHCKLVANGRRRTVATWYLVSLIDGTCFGGLNLDTLGTADLPDNSCSIHIIDGIYITFSSERQVVLFVVVQGS